jgi:2-phosphosulfolactate phosphatase
MHLAVSLAPATLDKTMVRFVGGPVTYVVIDILRASTTICTALANGAREVIPFGTVDEARNARERDEWHNALLCGEREAKKLPGFDLGNSPTDYTPEVVGGRSLLFASTNGSVAMATAPAKATVLVGGLVNTTAVADKIAELDQTTVIACSGKFGQFALEDAVGAGAIISKLWERAEGLELVDDGAMAAQAIWDQYKEDPSVAMWQCRHGMYLIQMGFGSDLSLCSAVDSHSVVPVMSDGRLVAAE